MAAPLANQLEEATTSLEIVAVRPEVVREVLDPVRKDSDLDFRGARIATMLAKAFEDFVFALLRQQP